MTEDYIPNEVWDSERENFRVPARGVISPVLSNLFLHYVFDKWIDRIHPDKPFARYTDDGVSTLPNKERNGGIKRKSGAEDEGM